MTVEEGAVESGSDIHGGIVVRGEGVQSEGVIARIVVAIGGGYITIGRSLVGCRRTRGASIVRCRVRRSFLRSVGGLIVGLL